MTTIKIETELDEAKAAAAALRTMNEEPEVAPMPPAVRNYLNTLSTAIKEAEEVAGPFGRSDSLALTFRGEIIENGEGGTAQICAFGPVAINRILSQHFVSKDELRKALEVVGEMDGRSFYDRHRRLQGILEILIEKGAPDA